MMKIKKPKLEISKLSVVQILPKIQSIVSIPELSKSKNVEVSFEVELTPMFNLHENAIKIDLTIIIDFHHKKKIEKNVAKFSFDFIYEYESLVDLLDEEGDLIPDIFLTCSNLSYSTLRGIIYTKSANTCIENVLLPIVTGNELIKGFKTKN